MFGERARCEHDGAGEEHRRRKRRERFGIRVFLEIDVRERRGECGAERRGDVDEVGAHTADERDQRDAREGNDRTDDGPARGMLADRHRGDPEDEERQRSEEHGDEP